MTTKDGRTFRVECDMVDVTTMDEPDPAWRFVDAKGHEHTYADAVAKIYSVPTAREVVDYPGDDEYPAIWHYECVQCGEVVLPGRRATRDTQRIAGLRHYYINDLPVSEAEFRRQFETDKNGQ